MKFFVIILLVLTLAIATSALPNVDPQNKQRGSGWTISKANTRPQTGDKSTPNWKPQPHRGSQIQPHKPVNPWKPGPPKPPHQPKPPVTHKPSLSWGTSKTSNVVHLPTHSVGHQPWKRNEHRQPQPYHGGGGKTRSVTRKPWQPPRATSTSSSRATSTYLSMPTATFPPKQPGKGNGNGNGWNSGHAFPGHGNGNGWPKAEPKPEPGNGWHVAQPPNNGFGNRGRASNKWKHNDYLEG